MIESFFENEKKTLKREVDFKSLNILLCGMIIASSLICFGINVMQADIVGVIMNLALVGIWMFMLFNDIKFLKKQIDLSINFLKDLHEIKTLGEINENKFLGTKIKELEKEVKVWKSRAKINGDDKTLDEILKEQENGDTKEFKCELEQSN